MNPENNKPTIAFVSTMISVPWGGSEELWSRTAEKLSREGYEIHVNFKEWIPASEHLTNLRKSGCQVEERFFYRPLSMFQKISSKVVGSSRFNSRYDLDDYLTRIKADLVIICQGSNNDGLEWMEACFNRAIPYASISQACAESSWPDDNTAERMIACFNGSRGNYFVSKRNLDLTVKQIGAEVANGEVVRNPFNVNYENSVDWNLSDTSFKLAAVGRVQCDAKGHDLLMEVLRQDKWKERSLQVTFFGNGPNKRSLERLKALWDLKQVNFGGFVNNIESIWQDHHGLILPSRYEGLPLAVVEAMLCKRICIVTDVAGNNEMIKDNINGFLAKAPTSELLDEAMERAWQKRKEWKVMGEMAYEHVTTAVPKDPIATFADLIKKLIF